MLHFYISVAKNRKVRQNIRIYLCSSHCKTTPCTLPKVRISLWKLYLNLSDYSFYAVTGCTTILIITLYRKTNHALENSCLGSFDDSFKVSLMIRESSLIIKIFISPVSMIYYQTPDSIFESWEPLNRRLYMP